MPIFKPKSSKILNTTSKNAITLDNKHRSIIDEITNDENEKLPKLKETKQRLKQTYQQATTIDAKLDIKEQIDLISHQIKEIKIAKKEYYLDNSKYVFEYYETKKQHHKVTDSLPF